MKIALGFGPKQLAEHIINTADFDTVAEFIAEFARRLPGKTHHISKSSLIDSAAGYLYSAKSYLEAVGNPYEPYKDDK